MECAMGTAYRSYHHTQAVVFPVQVEKVIRQEGNEKDEATAGRGKIGPAKKRRDEEAKANG